MDKASLLADAIEYIKELQSKLGAMEEEKRKLVGNSMDWMSMEGDTKPPAVDIEAGNGGVILRLSSPLESHPAAKIIRALEDTRTDVLELKLVAGIDTVLHSFVIKCGGSREEMRMESFRS